MAKKYRCAKYEKCAEADETGNIVPYCSHHNWHNHKGDCESDICDVGPIGRSDGCECITYDQYLDRSQIIKLKDEDFEI